MSGPQFYETRLGREYFQATLPNLVRQLHRLNDLLALHVELIEKRQNAPQAGGCRHECPPKD